MALLARSIRNDPFQNHKFHVFDTQGMLNLNTPTGGFSSVTIPELTIDMGEYREGLWVYSRKFPLRPHVGQVSLHKGVFLNDSTLFKMARATAEGLNYRTHLKIAHYHKTDIEGMSSRYQNQTPSREIYCYNAMMVRMRPSSDFDSMNADISLEEVDFEVEYMRLFVNGQEVTI